MKILILTFFPLFAFSQVPDESSGQEKNCIVEIYLLKSLRIDSANNCRFCFIPLKSDLEDTAFIKNNEIIGYEIIGDSIYNLILSKAAIDHLRPDREASKLSSSSRRDLPSYDFYNIAFAVVVNGEPVYGGWLRTRYLSLFVDWVVILTPLDEDGDGKLTIDAGIPASVNRFEGKTDPRSDRELIDCLQRSGRLIYK